MRKKNIILTLIVVLIYLLLSVFNIDWIESLELFTLNVRMRIRGEIPHEDNVIIVGIDDRSLSYFYQQEGNSWPWSRDIYADIINKLAELDVKSIMMDISFDTYREDQQGDNKFAQALFLNPFVTIGTLLINSKEEFLELDELYQKKLVENDHYLNLRYRLRNLDQYYLPDFFTTYKMIPPETMFMHSAYGYGTYEIGSAGADGIYHSIPLVIREAYFAEKKQASFVLLPSINILGLSAYLDLEVGEYIFDLKNKEIILGEQLSIPVDKSGYFKLNYYGKRAFQEISVIDLLHTESEKLKDIFADKLVLVGYTARAKGIYDARPTPFNLNESGVQIHATVLENILGENFLIRLEFWQNLLIIFIVFICSQLILKITKLKLSITLNFLFIIFLNFFNYILFLNNIWMDIFYLNLILFIYLLANVIIKVYQENKERLQTKSFFSRYVPEAVVEEILADPTLIKPGGEEKEITVLFSDIVNFTGISSQLTAKELVRLLNEYLGEMSDIIKNKYTGTLDKFIGDAIVAIFGTPFPRSDDPFRAVAAALAMKEKAKELEEIWQKRGEKFVFQLGIGINTGKAVVGNIGSPERVNYTCIGDTVNIAARLEAATRETATTILISQETYNQVKDYFICKKIDGLSLKGKEELFTVYSVLDYMPGMEV